MYCAHEWHCWVDESSLILFVDSKEQSRFVRTHGIVRLCTMSRMPQCLMADVTVSESIGCLSFVDHHHLHFGMAVIRHEFE